MADESQFIAFDIGAESGRCVIGRIDTSAPRLSLHEVHRFPTPSVESGSHLHWDILQLYAEIESALAQAGDEFGPHFQGISVDTWGVDYVLLDADDRLVGYPYHYRDSRTDGLIQYASTILPRDKIYEYTGIQFMQLNTLYQLLAEKRQTLDWLTVASDFLPIPNYLLYLLSGQKTAEYTIASTTQLCDPRTRNWSGQILEAFGFEGTLFPPVTQPGTVLSTLVPAVAEKTGITMTTPVIAGASHDTAAAVASIPAEGDDWAFLSSGTWSLMGVELEEPVITGRTQEYNFTNEGGVEGTTRFLKNIMGLWPLQQCREVWNNQGEKFDYKTLQNMAQKIDQIRAWVDVDDSRFLKPENMVESIISFLSETDQSYKTDPAWITRCILESLAFKYRMVIDDLELLTGKQIQTLHAVGGGIQNTLLNQLTADAIGRPVVTGPVEGTAAGNIGVQALATELIDDLGSLRQIIRQSFALKTYEPADQGYWDDHFASYQSILTT
ncbi:MAG: rhamnulokinase [Candidatus Marinimicrobia bacterium]|nr:rhamnulokinase [Candidatus Neomarinimicrobiota bacterium]MCF7828310.1 rhamnulokinase [Candidatus Neomarinimicrobiota bacterium]MCF7879515.1 rhamnulokinase [Candidatus Neomarinimicrobiota bacterium]